jgi:hypothetical protein
LFVTLADLNKTIKAKNNATNIKILPKLDIFLYIFEID